MKKFAIILAGCGQHDGSETHEVILTLLSLEQEHAQWEAFAPDVQHPVMNHLSETQNVGETRSVLQESARLVRGNVQSLEQADFADVFRACDRLSCLGATIQHAKRPKALYDTGKYMFF